MKSVQASERPIATPKRSSIHQSLRVWKEWDYVLSDAVVWGLWLEGCLGWWWLGGVLSIGSHSLLLLSSILKNLLRKQYRRYKWKVSINFIIHYSPISLVVTVGFHSTLYSLSFKGWVCVTKLPCTKGLKCWVRVTWNLRWRICVQWPLSRNFFLNLLAP